MSNPGMWVNGDESENDKPNFQKFGGGHREKNRNEKRGDRESSNTGTKRKRVTLGEGGPKRAD